MPGIFCDSNIIEQFTCSKSGNNSKNEDGLFINDNYVSVIDGATSKSHVLYAGKTGGQILKDSIIQTLGKLKGDENYIDVVNNLQNDIIEMKKQYNIEHAAASVVIFSNYHKQLWLIGDCQACIGSKRIRFKHKIDTVLSETRSVAIRAFLKQGYTIKQLQDNDLGRELILPILKMQRYFENATGKYGYYVLNTDAPPINPITLTKVYQVQTGDEVILASDGYPVLKKTLEQSEECLSKILEKDPLLYKMYPSTKGKSNDNVSFDDRTYVRFLVP